MESVSIHDVDARARVLEKRWQRLCDAYLPLTETDSIWRSHRVPRRNGPVCGWKLHLSATILNAPAILERVAPFLVKRRVQFKAARSLEEVSRLNSGLIHAYSQIGKVITVYPRTDRELVFLARWLHELTRHFKAPSVPFDLRFTDESNVYYRFGAFSRIEIEQPNGEKVLMMQSPDGHLVADVRDRAKPDWANDPFENLKSLRRQKPRRPRKTENSFQVLRALVQRGKGGVYQAIDFNSTPPRLCLLKEGRRLGEVGWDGRDGAWRVRHEETVLSKLAGCGISVPRIYSRFKVQGNFYLVMEFIDGESLHNLLLRRARRLPLARVLSYGVQIAGLLEQMHRAGWAWRDCKPKNLIVTSNGRLVPIDFEGAAPITRPDPVLWSTRGFVPMAARKRKSNGASEDFFALGAILYLLLTGRVFDEAAPVPIETLRKNVPLELSKLVESLLKNKTPAMPAVVARLNSIFLQMTGSKSPRNRELVKAA